MENALPGGDTKENTWLNTPSTLKTRSVQREFPSTPAGRVPLADLIGNNEDLKDRTPQGSPVEAVSWNKSPQSSSQSHSFMTPMVNRKRKRPRSASAGNSAEKRPIEQAKPQPSLNVPQNDPAFDLESQYFGHRYQTPSKPASSAAADFITSSSPQTPGPAAVDTAKLKRTSSCGTAYPPGNKRRKVEVQLDLRPITLPQESSKKSDGKMQEISWMLDSIHHDLPASLRISQPSPPAKSRPAAAKTSLDPIEESDGRSVSSRQGSFTGPADPAQSLAISQRSEEYSQSSGSDDNELRADLEALTENEILALSAPSDSKDIRTIASPQLPGQVFSETLPENIKLGASEEQPNKVVLDDDIFDEFDDEEELDILASYCEPEITQPSLTLPDGPPVVADDVPLEVDTEPLDKEPGQNDIIEVSDDEFDDGIDDEFCNDLYAASQVPQQQTTISTKTPIIQQYVIVSVSDGSYHTPKGVSRPEKILQLENVKDRNSNRAALLRGCWVDGLYPEGYVVHVLGEFDHTGQCVVNDTENWLIVNPDHLVSATVVADSFGCTRRAVLQDRVKATNGATEALVYGNILHEVFQESLKANRWDDEWLETTIAAVCSRCLESLYEINIEPPLAISNLMAKASGLRGWAEMFVAKNPKPNARIADRGQRNVLMSVNKLLEVEEHIWSPKFGLKGNIDATIQVVMDEEGQQKTLTVPLELKTGRNTSNASHQAQTALYTLLLSDRYDIDVIHGVLFYLESSSTTRVTAIRNEIMSMIQQRNKIAIYARNRSSLPPMLQDSRLCGKCYAKTPCFVYHKLVEDGDGKTSGLKEDFTRLVKHLKPVHKGFFMKWDSLLSKEEGDVFRFRKELWTMLSPQREKVGRCFGGLLLDTNRSEEMPDAPKINRYKYTFIKEQTPRNFSFTESQITTGEPIVISDEDGHYALANGYVVSVRPTHITVVVDRRLQNVRTKSKNFDAVRNQSFSGIMQVGSKGSLPSQHDQDEPMKYRLDKDEFSNGMAIVRNNLIRLMDSDAYGSETLRRLIIEGKAPEFEEARNVRDWISSSQSLLNIDQQNAIRKVMSAKNYALVLGMPGTGKTTTIAHIIRALVLQGKSVLLTSYTHTAVDNILLKIKDDKTSVLRLGAASKIHPEVQGFASIASESKQSFEELRQSYSAQVVATTCLGVNHAIFNAKIFDYCIVDEASQITLPVCLGPIAMAKRFVLVGDHYQLPPLVQNKEAQEGGLDISLFKLLSDTHPSSVVNLEHQYRMCEDIMSLSNTLIYSGRLKCGTAIVAEASINIPNMTALRSHHHSINTLSQGQTSFCTGPNPGSCWLRDTLDPSRRVIFLNTDNIGPSAQEIVNGTRITNPFEVTITTQAVEALLSVGIPPADIGVITLYRSQLTLLKHSLRHRSHSSYAAPAAAAAVEMHTADKFQGRDKEAVVLSLVRSNENGSIGDLLQDWRRVNVALTRARTKLVIVGSFSTIARGTELLGKFCDMIHRNGWRYDLLEGAGQAHCFEEWRSQTQGYTQQGKLAPKQGDTATMEHESDIEVGSSGWSPKKKTSGGQKFVNKPFKQVRFDAPKGGKIDARHVLSKRVVLGDIINDVLGSTRDGI